MIEEDRKCEWPVATYSVFDIPFIGVGCHEFIQLEFLILVFLFIQLLFLDEPTRVRREYVIS